MKATIVVAALLFVASCTVGGPAEGEGEGGDVGEGEGEGEVIPTFDLGAPPSGYSTTPPTGFGDAACSTNQWWQLGDREAETMHPGGDCMTCHAQERGPSLDVAGTVMGYVKDGTDCRGIPGVQVDIIAHDGSVAGSLTTNAAGNLFATGDVSAIAPYTVRLTYQGRTSEMLTPQTDGNCMHCHTVDGANNAPGRIFAP
jgi:hypothetical protein